MKGKYSFFVLLALLFSMTLNAQTIVKGDMNDDNEVTIADVTSLVNVVLGKAPLETISAGCSCEPYQVDNSSVVGSWSTPDGTSFQFNEDGTTTFPGGATYEFMPMQGRLLVYDAENQPVKAIPILKVESEKILTVDYATNTFTYFTKGAPEVTYYWYVGTTMPSNPNNSAENSGVNKWTEFLSTPTQLQIESSKSIGTWYVAIPSDYGFQAYDSTGSAPDTAAYTKSQLTIGSVVYDLFTSNNTMLKVNAVFKP
jgi:hypothetical protein